VLVGAEDWESLQETLFWLCQPGIREEVDQARAEYQAGEALSQAEVRARLNLPSRGWMAYAVVMASTALRNLERVPPRYAAAILEFIYVILAQSPARVGRPLEREFEGLHGARRGDYRLLCGIREYDTPVLVVRIEHRAHVHRPR